MAPESAADRQQQAVKIRVRLRSGELHNEPDMEAIAKAFIAYAKSEAVLHRLIAHSRAQGRSWADLGRFLGVTRQAVRQRFTHEIPSLPHRRNT